MAKKTIHYVLSHCHALCASPPLSFRHLPLVHSRAFAFEIIAAAFCMHSRWQLSGNGWTSASRAPSWPERWPINFIGRAVEWGTVRTVSQRSPNRYQFAIAAPLHPSPGKCCHETETGAGAEAETEAEAFTASRLSVYSHCYKLTNSLSPVKEQRGREREVCACVSLTGRRART